MFIAVVTNQDPFQSGRKEGDLGCFIAETKEEAIAKAVDAKARWELVFYAGHGYQKSYRVLVAELTEEAKVTNYKLEPLKEEF